jgi:hypothetical protein
VEIKPRSSEVFSGLQTVAPQMGYPKDTLKWHQIFARRAFLESRAKSRKIFHAIFDLTLAGRSCRHKNHA